MPMYQEKGVTIEIRAVVLIRVERTPPLISPPTIRAQRKSRSEIDDGAIGASCGTESKNDARGTVALLGLEQNLPKQILTPCQWTISRYRTMGSGPISVVRLRR